jgi:hypothetical protein
MMMAPSGLIPPPAPAPPPVPGRAGLSALAAARAEAEAVADDGDHRRAVPFDRVAEHRWNRFEGCGRPGRRPGGARFSREKRAGNLQISLTKNCRFSECVFGER